ncbi:MAG: choice-of-anchor D domain-containing protein [Deltaproteobacteria bacterium]|nr:MAG: choice-of-anchor D domain-containing protein [Deltaproteobacteria bacterium]
MMKTKALLCLGALLCLYACDCEGGGVGQLDASIEVTPSTVDFGKTPLGVTRTSTLKIRNGGTFRLRAENFQTSAPFGTANEPIELLPGAEAEVELTFTPDMVGHVQGTLTFESNDPEAPEVTVTLAGEGIEAAVAVDPPMVDFGEVLWQAGTATEFRQVTVTNPGSDAFELTAIEIIDDASGAFGIDPKDVVGTFTPGESRNFEVSFLPTQMGPVSASVRIATTAPPAPEVIVPLTGTAVGPMMEVCSDGPGNAEETCTADGESPVIDFGAIDRLSMATGTLRILNVGSHDLRISQLRLGSGAVDFSIDPPLPAMGETIGPMSEKSWTVTYAPEDWAPDSSTLTVAGNSKTRPVALVQLSGRVRRPDIDVVPLGLTFNISGTVTESIQTVEVHNLGEDPLVLSSITLVQDSGPVMGALTVENVPPAGTTVDPGSFVTFDVAFRTSTPGNYEGRVIIDSNDPLDPTVEMQISAQKR